ncbi:MAG: F0F1 ATP synthase subunit B [Clostridiales bacterium]|nr:F0F1 ATP synthase subunit B [Clostridiales bacterium]
MDGRLFGLDVQLVFDAIVMFVFIMLLYLIMSKLFFKPVRAFMEKRQEGIDDAYAGAKDDHDRALELKAVYEEKLKNVNKEAENLMSISRRMALRQQEEILDNARAQAREIMTAARQKVTLEKARTTDEVKRQSAALAVLMASEFVTVSRPENANAYVEEIYREMDGDTWQS